MDNIGNLFQTSRESSGLTIDEVSDDLGIKSEYLLNIEEGKIGCFKDIFELKNYITSYAKYLGLDSEKLIDEFNEYMFEYTSKIPIKEIEKQVQNNQEVVKIASPYTKKPHKYSSKYYLVTYFIIFILIIVAIVWSIKQITIDNTKTNAISYVKLRK